MPDTPIYIDQYRGNLEEAIRLLAGKTLHDSVPTPGPKFQSIAGIQKGKIRAKMPLFSEVPDLYKKHVQRTMESILIECPLNVPNMLALKDAGVSFLPKLQKWYEQEIVTGKKPEPVSIPTLKLPLYPYQQEAVAWVHANDGTCLLGHEMGLGKSPMSLAYLELNPDVRPAIIICPAHLKINWQREAQKFMSKPRTIVLYGQKAKALPEDAGIVILNYDIVKFWLKELVSINPQILICDEVQAIKEPTAQRTKAVKSLAHETPRRLFLSGTPVVNRPSEFFVPLNLIDPINFPSFQQFVKRYTHVSYNGYRHEYKGVKNAEELHNRLKNSIMLRRTKEEVLPQLAHKNRIVLPLEITNRKEYDDAETDLLGWIFANKGPDAVQAAASAEAVSRFNVLKQLAWEGKKKAVVAWVKEFLDDTDESIILFAHHRATVAFLAEALRDYGVVKVVGGMTPTAKQKSVDRFQSGAARVFLGSLAAKEGLTLTRASTCAFVELWWTPGAHEQAESRHHRVGQQADTVEVYYLVADDTIDTEMLSVLDAKRKVLSSILDGRDMEQDQLLVELMRKMERKNDANR